MPLNSAPVRTGRLQAYIDQANLAFEGGLHDVTRVTDRRTRLMGATGIALLLHGLLLWSLLTAQPKAWNIHEAQEEDDIPPVELWQVQPEPEPKPEPVKRIQPKPVTQPEVKPAVQPENKPEPQPQVKPETKVAPLPPQPVVPPQVQTPAPPRVVIRQQPSETFTAPSRDQLKAESNPSLAKTDTAIPQVSADEPYQSIGKTKKKEEDQLKARTLDTAGSASNLNLHVAPLDQSLPSVAPSGLAPPDGGATKAVGGKTASGGRMGTVQLPGIGGAGGGVGLNGRGSATQALQNHDYCVVEQQTGKPIPKDCNMKDLASMPALGMRPGNGMESTVRRKEAMDRYKSGPGNSDYWDRVNHVPRPEDHTDSAPKPGAYTDPKAQRAWGGTSSKTADPTTNGY